MATLELATSRLAINQYQHQQQQHNKGKPPLSGSMQRTRGMGRPQQREPPSTELLSGQQDSHAALPTGTTVSTQQNQQQHPPRPTRNNSKLKVLVRSQALREETSPPREPTTTGPAPCIKLNTSPSISPTPPPSSGTDQSGATILVCNHTPSSMPSSPTTNPCLIVSPTEDIVADSPPILQTPPDDQCQSSSTVRTQDALNSAITRKLNQDGGLCVSSDKDKCAVSSDCNSSPSQTSANRHQKNCVSKQMDSQRIVDNTRNLYNNCDCFTPSNCTKCSKNNERNINNNNSNNINNNVVNNTASSNNTLTVNRANSKHKLRHQSSSQGSFEGSSSNSPCLSRDSSTELYTDTTGIDLTQFIIETLNKNAKDRVMMLKIEQELVTLAKDKIKTHFKFPPMSSYQRMLVHRCAAYFGMDHNIEVSGKCVVVNKTKTTRIPEMRFRDHIREDLLFPEEPRRSILKRDSNSFEDCNYKSPDRQFDNRRSKSFEEREEEYEKARRRIFRDGSMQNCNSQEDFNWAEMPWPESECTKIRLLPPEPQNNKQNRLLKVQSVEGRSETLRPCVAKSYSFGGYGGAVSVLTRGDSVTSTHSAGPRLLTKQDSSTSTISWRLSPSSSGYKSQSQRSDSVTPSPTATPHQLSDASGKNSLEGVDPMHHSITEETVEQGQQTDKQIDTPPAATENNQLVWAVTDMQSVPKGSILIDPQTGQPLTNRDGSLYHFDPSNPPPGFPTSKPPPSPPKPATPQKSPVKERSQSPKKQPKSRASPLKNKSCLINSSTSPSLPMTPPTQNHSNQSSMAGGYSTVGTPMDGQHNVAMQPYPVYPNGFVQTQIPGDVSMYQPQLGMVYAPYGVPQPYENRPDTSMTDLTGYFVNMTVSDPTCQQSVAYQPQSSGYWSQQPITYYQPPPQASTQNQQPPQQRYPAVQMPVPGQTTASPYYPQNYVPVAGPNPAQVGSVQNTEIVPVYAQPNHPMQVVYPTGQVSAPNPVYIQNPNPVVYSQNAVFPTAPQGPVYSNITTIPPSNTYNPSNQCYNQTANTQNFISQSATSYEQRTTQQSRTTPKVNKQLQGACQKMQTSYSQHTASGIQHQSSNQSSGGSNSPANTVIAGYFPTNSNPPINYRQTPPETPPTQNIGYGYSPTNYVPHSVIFRPLGGIRASPPVNLRSSRSPTPGPDFSQVNSMDRNQRFSVPPAMYHGMPCIVPGDMRLMTGRTQAPVYRQPYRQQSAPQNVQDSNSSNRANKPRKPRTKVPALPPSGRQSNQTVQSNNQHRF